MKAASFDRKAIPAAVAAFDTLPDSAFVKAPTVRTLLACSSATLWRRVKAGAIPAPCRLGPGSVGWRVGDLRATLRALAGE